MKLEASLLSRFAATFLLLLWSLTLIAQPVSDANGFANSAPGSTTISLNGFVVPANDNRLLVVCTVNTTNQITPTVTFDGIAMTLAKTHPSIEGMRNSMYYLVLGSGSAIGGNIVASGQNIIRIGASSFHNVDQSDPTSGEVSASVLGGATSAALNVGSTADGLVCACLGYYASGFTGLSADPGQTQVFQSLLTPSPTVALAQSVKAGTGASVSMVWALNGTTTGGTGAHVGMNIKSSCPATGNVWYVNPAAAAGGNGASWSCAFQNLQDALDAAGVGHEVWVKAGTYLPTKDPFGSAAPADPRSKTFFIKDGVAVYGGFAGTETARSQRNVAANVTILSGDLGTVGDNTDNAYHVAIASAPSSGGIGVTIDGFTVTGGKADGSGYMTVSGSNFYRNQGGGISVVNGTNTLRNNTFSGNLASIGGSVSIYAGTNTLAYNIISENSSLTLGGGFFLSSGTNTVINNIFEGNMATYGGGIYVNLGVNTVANNVFTGNTVSYGGGFYGNQGINTLTNNTFFGNEAGVNGGGVTTQSSTNYIKNCIFWGNTINGNSAAENADIFNFLSTNTITHCLTQPNSTYSSGTGIINNQDPLFEDANDVDGPDNLYRTLDDGLQLRPCSPAINIGDNASIETTLDIAGSTRILRTTVDMGAYEFGVNMHSPSGITNTPASDGLSAMVNWNTESGATDYNLRYRQCGVGTWLNKSTSDTTFNITGLQPCRCYEVQVKAKVCGVWSVWSDLDTLNMPGILSLSAGTITNSSCCSPTGQVAFYVMGGTAPYTVWGVASVTQNEQRITLSSLDSGAYCVVVTDAGGCSANSCYSVGVGSCSRPTGLTAVSNAPASVTLNWNAANCATNYQIQRQRCAGGSAGVNITTSANSHTFTGLQTDTCYRYRVRAQCCNNRWSPFSSWVNVTATVAANGTINIEQTTNETDQATSIADGSDTRIAILPNPTHDAFRAMISDVPDGEIDVMLTNMFGSVIEVKQLTATDGFVMADFDMSSLPAGLYILQVRTCQERYSQTVIRI